MADRTVAEKYLMPVAHVEYDLEFEAGQSMRLHVDCEQTWRAETGN